MSLIIDISTTHPSPTCSCERGQEGKLKTDHFEKILHEFINALPSFIAAHRDELSLKRNIDPNDVIVKVHRLDPESRNVPDILVEVQSAYKGKDDPTLSRANRKLNKLLRELLDVHGKQDYTIRGIVKRGQKNAR